MRRRSFLRVAGTATAAGLAAAGCGPEGTRTVTGLVTDEEPPLAQDRWVQSLCALCPGGCGIQVRLVEDRAVKIEGDPGYRVNRGGLCARGQAGLQVPYHPDRIAGPLRRRGARGEGRWEPVSWDAALQELRDELLGPGADPRLPLLFVADRMRGHRRIAVDLFLRHAGSPAAMICEVFGEEPVRLAAGAAFGRHGLPDFDLDRCSTLLSVGMSLVEAGPSPVSFQRGLSALRSRPGPSRGRFIHVEPRYSVTAAAADEWIPARPGTEGALLLALAFVIVKEDLHDKAYLRESTRGFRPGDWLRMSPARAAGITDVEERAIVRLARSLATEKPSAVVFGGSASGYTNSVAAARAATVVNALLGAWADPDGVMLPPAGPVSSRVAGADPAGWIASEPARAILVSGADPVYLRPSIRSFLESEASVPLLVSFSPFMDDTSSLADWILPDLTFLERCQSDVPEGSANRAGAPVWFEPAIAPVVDARSLVEVLMELAPDAFEHHSDREMAAAWARSLSGSRGQSAGSRPIFEFPEGGLDFERPNFERLSAEHPLVLIGYPSLALADGSTAHLPWMQELTDPLSGLRWGFHVEMNPRDARALQVGEGDLVEVVSEVGSIEAVLRLRETVMPGTVAAPAGQGHGAYGRYAENRGSSIFELLHDAANERGGWAWGATRVDVRKPRRRSG